MSQNTLTRWIHKAESKFEGFMEVEDDNIKDFRDDHHTLSEHELPSEWDERIVKERMIRKAN